MGPAPRHPSSGLFRGGIDFDRLGKTMHETTQGANAQPGTVDLTQKTA
jgi:hypothetical protein